MVAGSVLFCSAAASISELQSQITELERMRSLYEDLTGVKVNGVFEAEEEEEDGEGGNADDNLEFECEQRVKNGTLRYVMQLQKPPAASGQPPQYIYAPTDETRADVANGLLPGYFGKNVQFAKSNGGRWFRLGVQKGW
ncbi:hypothetical protein M427DRAFT_443902 [Gonapodya prolifera JEL478]|uniref:Monopolin complex subunit Csm1/Pcs1 C-terminal domain-containing protein n=1 Tax=Gonapodya prolifera (strain JEL478) TaxID=1344416 RepID=A0A139A3Y6_GONPJ|nr:hypothetical protein M427DRAFT_443902 [Gonapodya prolifera JEL478]|eukprot:KXS11175.1 hypothetical protein M427DRAFT_443902 [Gonapodya prolifera JEL478]